MFTYIAHLHKIKIAKKHFLTSQLESVYHFKYSVKVSALWLQYSPRYLDWKICGAKALMSLSLPIKFEFFKNLSWSEYFVIESQIFRKSLISCVLSIFSVESVLNKLDSKFVMLMSQNVNNDELSAYKRGWLVSKS